MSHSKKIRRLIKVNYYLILFFIHNLEHLFLLCWGISFNQLDYLEIHREVHIYDEYKLFKFISIWRKYKFIGCTCGKIYYNIL